MMLMLKTLHQHYWQLTIIFLPLLHVSQCNLPRGAICSKCFYKILKGPKGNMPLAMIELHYIHK